VPSRDAGVVEADVGGDAAADPGPAALDREDLDLVVLAAEGQVVPRSRELPTRFVQPGRRLFPVGDGEFDGGGAVVLPRLEDRVATEAGGGSAVGALGQRLALLEGELGAADQAEKRSRAGKGAGFVSIVQGAAADRVEDDWLSFCRCVRY